MPLLAPDPRRIGRPPGEPAPDRAPDSLAAGTPEPLRGELVALLGEERVLGRAIDLVRFASDASPYRLLPKAVVMAHDAGDVAKVFRFARARGIPVTLRSAGSSLNGQAQGDGILVDVRRHFAGVRVEAGGARARVRPGTVLGHANRVLARHGTRLGPDPASTDVATVGGVIANNSGGMRCGVTEDSYSTLRSLTFVLPSGTVIDTAAADAEERFAREEPELAEGLLRIRDELRADPDLVERVERKFRIKNTMGYRLCAFLDADTPVEIFRRLLVGSEGTLAFVAEAVFDTVRDGALHATALLPFADLDAAAAAVPGLVAAGARAVELMMATTLHVARNSFPDMPDEWEQIPLDAGMLLVELRSDEEAELARKEEEARRVLDEFPPLEPPEFTRDAELTHKWWTVREGMFGLVGRMRPPENSLITEDVCVPPERIAECAADLKALLAEHGFLPGVAGHASAGNLHFMLTPAFGQEGEVERYERFIGALAGLILDKYDGSLKAEHGTGINMAPFVEREWGRRATELMWEVKRLADPGGVLAPGVVLNDDPGAHLRNLKTNPPIEEVAAHCVECGFCEPVCPSRNITTTPRQRIVIRREMARQPEGSPVLAALLDEYEYDAIETCAADGTCRLACPVAIDTGKLVKEFRARQHTPRTERVATAAAERWDLVERAARASLRAGDFVTRHAGTGPMRAAAGVLRSAVSSELVPTWPAEMPRPAPAGLPTTRREGAAAVYLPACINRIFGRPRGARGGAGVVEAMVSVSERAGVPLWIPADVPGICCGVPWSSKGFRAGHALMAERAAGAIRRWTGDGELPLVTDASSCTHGLREDGVTVLDSLDWLHDEVLPRLSPRRARSVAVHPTCSVRHMGTVRRLESVAAALAEEVVVPETPTCCGFAGDRGFLHPELPATAVQPDGGPADACVSTNRTCELGLHVATGRPYVSLAELVEELTRPARD